MSLICTLRGNRAAAALTITFFMSLPALPAFVDAATDDSSTQSSNAKSKNWVKIEGVTYGAKPDERGPIGGGEGFKSIITDGNYRVATRPELIEALHKARPGEVVYVEPNARIDLTVWVHINDLVIEIPEGVTLASNRGHEGSRGALIYSDTFDTDPLIRATGPNVTITGLRVRGPDDKRRMDLHRAAFQGESAPGHELYYKFPNSNGISTERNGLEVVNCELSGWSHGAINLEDSSNHTIHHNHIHHNQRHGLGYGVSMDKAEAVISYNLFNWNRHGIAATGRPGTSYTARHNVLLENANGHLLDMHGGRDREDGTDIAGTRIRLINNTIVNTQDEGIVIRGMPEKQAIVRNNWFHRADVGRPAVISEGNTQVADNVYGTPPKRKSEDYRFEARTSRE